MGFLSAATEESNNKKKKCAVPKQSSQAAKKIGEKYGENEIITMDDCDDGCVPDERLSSPNTFASDDPANKKSIDSKNPNLITS
jgi:hypothetical protein